MTKSNSGVGYGRPPKHSRFKKGQSGNPKGRPKGARNFENELLDELSERITVRERGVTQRVSKRRAILKRMVEKALQGDARAAKALFDMLRLATSVLPPEPGPLPAQDREILERFLTSAKNLTKPSSRKKES